MYLPKLSYQDEHFQNGKVRAYENLLIDKSIEKTQNDHQNQFSATLKINQSLTTIQDVFIQDTQLNLSKNS